MGGAKVKGGADIRFAIKDDNPGKTAAAGGDVNGENDGITLLDFVGGIVLVAGVVGFAILFFAIVPAGWGIVLFAGSCLLVLGGGMLCWHTRRFNEAVNQVRLRYRYAQSEIAQTKHDLQAAVRAKDESVANAKKRVADAEEQAANTERFYKKQLAEVKAEAKTTEEKLRADMGREMESRENAAAERYEELQSEKKRVDIELSCVQQTLEYYSSNARLDVYSGANALRECGGIYVVKNIGDGRVKVGITDDNFKRRFGEIQSHCASSGIQKEDVLPEILVPLDEGKAEVEKEIHNILDPYKTAGEWFKVSPENAVSLVLRLVHKRRKGNFDGRTKMVVNRKTPDE